MKHHRVYRTELTPVSFLTRSAAVFPDKVAVVHGARRYTYRQFEERVNRLASALRRAGMQRHDRVAFLCPNIPAMLEAHFGVPAGGRHPGRHQHPAQPGRDRLHPGRTRGRGSCSSTRSSTGLLKPLDLGAVTRGPRGRHRRRRRSLRGLPGRRIARAGRPLARGRGRDHRHQLHLGHHRPAQGRHVHAPRRLGERDRRGHRERHVLRHAVSLDPAHVPLQRLVLHLGRDRRRRHPRVPAPRRVRTHLGHDRPGGHHPLQWRAHRADRRGQRSQGPSARASGDGDGGRGPALPHPARQAQGARLPAGARLRPHRDLRAAHRLRLAPRVGRASRRRAGAPGRAAGPGLRHLRSRARGRRAHERRAARRADAWARSS